MSGAQGRDVSAQAASYKCHVAHDVEEFVAGGLIGPGQRARVDVAQFGRIAVGHAQFVGQVVQAFLRHLMLIDDDGVVKVAALDESHLEERLYLAHKDKGTRLCDFLVKVLHAVKACRLALDEA